MALTRASLAFPDILTSISVSLVPARVFLVVLFVQAQAMVVLSVRRDTTALSNCGQLEAAVRLLRRLVTPIIQRVHGRSGLPLSQI